MTEYITHIKDHADTAKGYLLQQYKHKPNIDGLLTAIIEPLQGVEDKLYELYQNNSLEVARGYYLDRIGAIIGEARDYRTDHEYKLAILVRIISNNGGGTPEEILIILRSIYDLDAIGYSENGIAYFQIRIRASTKPKGINRLLAKLKPISVAMPAVIYVQHDDLFQLTEVEPEYNDTAYAELIVNHYNLNVDDDNCYLVKQAIPLETIRSHEDYIIKGGKAFAEVIMSE